MKIAIRKAADRTIRRMPRNQRDRVTAAIRTYADTGEGDVVKLQGRDGYRLRVGNWRVIFEIEDDTMVVIDAGARGGIYR
jgi:mRNA interferase RelE/StbE